MNELKQLFQTTQLDNGMVRTDTQPHTRDIEALPSACSGPFTGSYYFLCKYYDVSVDGETLLAEIAKLQDVDEKSPTYGCCRWYREEPCIRDTNAAFFVLLPIIEALLFCGEKISNREREILSPVIERATVWFARECEERGYHYPNKIMSDGALLLALAKLGVNHELRKKAYDFWNGWIVYTEKYGWGWGENTSKVYTGIMISALDVALSCLDADEALYAKLFGLRKRLRDYRAFHGEDYEFVPSIRTYNFQGLAVTGSAHGASVMSPYQRLANQLAGQLAPQYTPAPFGDKFHKEHIFGNSCAFTYKGEKIRLGTINQFPVMPGSYQNEGSWGLGWQSMPVSVLALNHETSFLRFASVAGGKLRTHPAMDKHSAFLDNALFGDENIPDVFTLSNQRENMAVVVRTMSHIANQCAYLADEWYMQHFDGEIKAYNGWVILDYGDCMFAVKALNGEINVIRDGEKVKLAQVLYEGEEKLLTKRRLTTAWAVAVFDGNDNAESKLDEIQTSYEIIRDLRYARPVAKPFKVTCGSAELCFDPDFSCEWGMKD